MDVLDLFLKRYSYKFPKGYIDVNDPKDKMILEGIFEKLGINEIEIKKVPRSEVPDLEDEEEKKKKSTITKKEIIDILEKEDLNDEQLKTIFSLISGTKYRQPVIDYITSKGKGPAKEALGIYNKLIETGDINEFAEYIKKPKKYSDLSDSGNFYQAFKPFSKEFIDYVTSLEPSIGRVSTGKGEILLSIMLGDVESAVGGGDIKAGGKPVEVKNKGALPMGQGFQFGVNTINSVFGDIEKGMDLSILDDEVEEEETEETPEEINEMSIKNVSRVRPFGKFDAVYRLLKKKDPTKIEQYNNLLGNSLKRRYVGLDLEDLDIASFEKGNSLDWEDLELYIGRKIVEKYVEDEGFEEVFFLNDLNKKYTIVPAKELTGKLGKEIQIRFPDGAPRWSYKFSKAD